MKKVMLVGILIAIVVGAVLSLGARAYEARLWLLPDYRDGYSTGTQLLDDWVQPKPQKILVPKGCRAATTEAYGRSDPMTDAATAFYLGCEDAVNGGNSDFDRVNSYLED